MKVFETILLLFIVVLVGAVVLAQQVPVTPNARPALTAAIVNIFFVFMSVKF